MPAIGRLLTALTGCPPAKSVDPDEAVALGCAVHVGVLDGKEEMGTVLNPMQAALLRAVIEKERREGGLDDMFDDENEFGDFER
jgi:molecular chaperone DnaK (HSP70)